MEVSNRSKKFFPSTNQSAQRSPPVTQKVPSGPLSERPAGHKTGSLKSAEVPFRSAASEAGQIREGSLKLVAGKGPICSDSAVQFLDLDRPATRAAERYFCWAKDSTMLFMALQAAELSRFIFRDYH